MKRSSLYVTLSAVAALSLGSCITPAYQRSTSLPVAEQYSTQQAEDSSSLAEMPWQEFFSDPRLCTLIDLALSQNLDLLSAESRIREAEAYYDQSLAAFFPSLNFGAQGDVARPEATQRPTTGTPIYGAQLGFTAGWEIDITGKLRSARKRERAHLLQTKAAYGAAQTQLIAQVANLYYQLVATDAQLNVCQTTIETRKESLRTLQLQMNSAKANLLGVSQAAAQLYYAQSLEPQLIAQRHALESSLCVLLGETPHAIQRSTMLSIITVDNEPSTGYPAQLLARRPDVMQAEQALIAAHQGLNIARAQLYPSLNIQASLNMDLMDWVNLPTSIFGSVLGGLTQPIFAQGKLQAAKRGAEEQRIQAEYAFLKALLNAQSEVADQLVLCDNTEQQAFYLTKQLGSLQIAAHSAMKLMKNGYASYLDLLYAQEALLGAEQQVIAAHLATAQAKINLYRALGGGWDPTSVTPAILPSEEY